MKTKKVLLMLAVFLGLASSVKAQQLTVEYLVGEGQCQFPLFHGWSRSP